MSKQAVGVIGSGDVGQVLGFGFAKLGHDVKIGSRDPKSEKLVKWVEKSGPRATSGSFAEAAKFGEVIVLATLWSGTKSAIDLAGEGAFDGKVVIDATNPLVFTPGGGPSLALGHTDSGGEQVQRWLPKARVVKAFNIVGNAHMFKPEFPGGPPDMFIAGNDDGAKKTVTELLGSFGWPAIDVGGIEGSRLLEPLCILWVGIGVRTNSWGHAFKLLRK